MNSFITKLSKKFQNELNLLQIDVSNLSTDIQLMTNEILRQRKLLCVQYHPDKNPDGEEMTKRVFIG